MIKFLLKLRDRSWFYTNQLYPNDSKKSNLKDFKLRFSMFFLPPIIWVIGSLGWFFSVVLKMKSDVNPHNYFIVLPLAGVFWFLFWNLYLLIFNKLSEYPFDKRNDSGYTKNSIFIAIIILLELTVVFSSIYFLFQIKSFKA